MAPPPPSAPSRLLGRLRVLLVQLFTENLHYKALSLLVAVGIWGWLQLEQVVMVRARANIEYTWPEGLVLANDVTTSAMINVRGPQGIVRNLGSEQLSIHVDLADAEQGSTAVDFTDKVVLGLPTGVSVVQVSPVGATVELDQAMTRQVVVRPALIGDLPSGYIRGEVTADPPIVEITGPQSVVRNIAEVSTDIVDISGFRDSKQVRVPLAIERRTVRPLIQQPITLSIPIEAIVATRVFQEVSVVERAAGWQARPRTARLTLRGPAEQLKRLEAAQISVLLHLPTPTPIGEPLTIRWTPDDSFTDADGGVQVVIPGADDAVEVIDLSPDRFHLEQQQ